MQFVYFLGFSTEKEENTSSAEVLVVGNNTFQGLDPEIELKTGFSMFPSSTATPEKNSSDIHASAPTLQKLYDQTAHYHEVAPPVGLFYLLEALNIQGHISKSNTPDNTFCHACGSVFTVDNCITRLKSKMAATPRIQRLLRRQKRKQSLGKFQKMMIERYETRKTKMSFLCKVCNTRTLVDCPPAPMRTKHNVATPPPMEPRTDKLSRSAKKRMKKKLKKSTDIEVKQKLFSPTQTQNMSPRTESSQLSSIEDTSTSFSSQSVINSPPDTSMRSPSQPRKTSTPVTLAKQGQQYGVKKTKKDKNAFHAQLSKILSKDDKDNSKKKRSLSDFLSSL